ncbi:MAG: host attachment protein [Candidatus Uhrbacteria bacterium]|nr:host attachment protein [Candidatus Uhrbacteria bacterium]
MFLPEQLQHFSEPTLIVLADHIHAQFWLAHQTTLEQKDTFSLPRERKTDNETSFVNTDHDSGSSPEPSDDDRLHHFVKMTAEHLTSLISTNHARAIYLVMSAELAHVLKQKLSPDTQTLIKKELRADLMKEDILEVIKRLQTLR